MIKKTLIIALLSLPMIASAGQLEHARGKRYCEILTSRTTTLSVYNTLTLNDCPEEQWKKITTWQIRKETGSLFVDLNGPRYMLMDTITNFPKNHTEPHVFGGIAMQERATVKVSLWDIISNAKPYHEHVVARDTVWGYDKEKPVYELISPEGSIYVMQSYSVQIINQSEDTLKQLAEKLKLPSGWQFKTGILNKNDQVKTSDNKAHVIQDEYRNTYQKADHDLLN